MYLGLYCPVFELSTEVAFPFGRNSLMFAFLEYDTGDFVADDEGKLFLQSSGSEIVNNLFEFKGLDFELAKFFAFSKSVRLLPLADAFAISSSGTEFLFLFKQLKRTFLLDIVEGFDEASRMIDLIPLKIAMSK